MKQALRNLIAQGSTNRAIAQLLLLTASDSDLSTEINLLSARFSTLEKQQRLGVGDDKESGKELNRINVALLDIVNRLAGAEFVMWSRRL